MRVFATVTTDFFFNLHADPTSFSKNKSVRMKKQFAVAKKKKMCYNHFWDFTTETFFCQGHFDKIFWPDRKGETVSELNLTDLSCLKDVMARFGISTKKKYGQNFLINRNVPLRIAEEGCPSNEDGVLEIGPGMGTLTRALCAEAKKVVCLEIDESLIPVLEYTLSDFDNVTVILQDVLKTDLKALCTEHFSQCKRVRVCANLPYYITTPVLMYLLESGVEFASVTVMVQKEVADRITAKAGSAEYGAITAAVAYYGKAEKLFTVSPGSFLPAPKVESAVMRITTHTENPYGDCNRKLLFDMMKAAFEQRRKTLSNTLRGILSPEEREALGEILVNMGFPKDVRGEKLDVSEYAVIAREIEKLRQREIVTKI
jgi:16S rRNA (adenine1518-N6/adenine1519-N6)-dimethyltransferase